MTLIDTPVLASTQPAPVLLDVNPADTQLVTLPSIPYFIYAKLRNQHALSRQADPWLAHVQNFQTYLQHILWEEAFPGTAEEHAQLGDRR